MTGRERFEKWWLRFLFALLFALMVSAVVSLKLSYEWQRGGFEPFVRFMTGNESRAVSWPECRAWAEACTVLAFYLFFSAGLTTVALICNVLGRLRRVHDREMKRRQQLATAAQPHAAGGVHP